MNAFYESGSAQSFSWILSCLNCTTVLIKNILLVSFYRRKKALRPREINYLPKNLTLVMAKLRFQHRAWHQSSLSYHDTTVQYTSDIPGLRENQSGPSHNWKASMRATNLERKQLSQSPCLLIHRPSTVFTKKKKKKDRKEIGE